LNGRKGFEGLAKRAARLRQSVTRAGAGWQFSTAAPRVNVLQRVPIGWNGPIDKNSLQIDMLEHVLIETVEQLFRDML
jgi:hypothetical protein